MFMSLPPLLVRFSRDEVIEAAWNLVIITTSLRTDATWTKLRQWLKSEHQIAMDRCICTGLGQVDGGFGLYLLTSDRRLVFGDFAEVSRTECVGTRFEDEHVIDPESVQEMVAVFFQSIDINQEIFDGLVMHCRRHDQDFKVKLGDRYEEAALLQTENYLDFHRDWLLPKLGEVFPLSTT
jgi:hypothetical protein